MTETQLRFVRAILERVPLDRVAELYVFPPMKQGIHESGIAVVAAVRESAIEEAASVAAVAVDPDVAETDVADAVAADALDAACDPTEDASRDARDGVLTSGDTEGDPAVVPDDTIPAVASHPERHTVYTARYRLTIKGPERGRWELNVVDEADAPLLTVEMVVRGVQRRAGDGAEPERIDRHALRELFHRPAAPATMS